MNSSAGEIELKGFARFSLRLQLLLWLSKSDNPIISYLSAFLLKDRLSRIWSAWAEIILVYVTPVCSAYGSLWFIWVIHIQSTIKVTRQVAILRWFMELQVMLSSFLPWIGIILMILVLVRPGVRFLGQLTEKLELKTMTITPRSMYGSLIYVQLVSFVLPMTIFYFWWAYFYAGKMGMLGWPTVAGTANLYLFFLKWFSFYFIPNFLVTIITMLVGTISAVYISRNAIPLALTILVYFFFTWPSYNVLINIPLIHHGYYFFWFTSIYWTTSEYWIDKIPVLLILLVTGYFLIKRKIMPAKT